MKYYLIAGEASGDLHAARLMQSIRKLDPQAEFRYYGGDRMQTEGGTQVRHYRDMAFMGFWEVLKNLSKLNDYIHECRKDILNYHPDALILVDYSGFNLRIAPTAKKAGIPVHFYIAPKVWAWNEKRVKKLKQYVDQLYVIFPFEKDYFEQKHKLPVHYVGNPLVDRINTHTPPDERIFRNKYNLDERPIITLLPGSRIQEIKKIFPIMLSIIPFFPQMQFAIGGAPGFGEAFYRKFKGSEQAAFIPDRTYDLLSLSHAALVTSGTATLETALFKVPQVVLYRTSALSYQIAKNLIQKNLQYISLVNLVAGKKIVEELIQNDCDTPQIKKALSDILAPPLRNQIFEDYHQLEDLLGGEGASERVAKIITQSIAPNPSISLK